MESYTLKPVLPLFELDDLPLPAWTASADLQSFHTNARWRSLTGQGPAERDIWSAFEPASARTAREHCAQARHVGEPFHVDVAMPSVPNNRWLRIHLAPTRNCRAGAATTWLGLAVDITAPHPPDLDGDVSESVLGSLLDFVDGVFWIASADLRRLFYLSAGYERLFGHRRPELRKQAGDWLDPVLPEDLPALRLALDKLGRGEVDRICAEFRVANPEKPRWLETHCRLVLDRHGNPWRLVGCITEITRHREIEIALRSSEERFSELSELSDDIFFSLAPDFSRFISPNPAHGRISGTDPKQIEHAPLRWIDGIHPDDRPALHEAVHLISSGEVDRVTVECRLPRKSDGSYRNVLVRAFLVRNPEGNPIKITGVVTDITERKRMEDALRVSEERFQLATQGTTDGLFDWDIVQNRVYFSPRWKELLGYSDAEIIDSFSEWKSRLHPNDLEREMGYINDFLAGRHSKYQQEFRLRHRDGSYRWVLARATLIRDPVGRPLRMVGSHVDLTAQRELERMVLEVSEQERRIVGYDLHDGLGQQLTAVEMMMQLAINRIPNDDGSTRQLLIEMSQLIRQSVAHVRTLSRGLAPTTPTGKGLVDALEELVQVSQGASGIRCQLHPSALQTAVDPLVSTQFYRIAQEAINNALKHSRAGRIDVSLRQAGSSLLLTVDDDGRGLDASQTDRHSHGIRIMHYRARLLGAQLEIAPRAEGGTSVRCKLFSHT